MPELRRKDGRTSAYGFDCGYRDTCCSRFWLGKQEGTFHVVGFTPRGLPIHRVYRTLTEAWKGLRDAHRRYCK